MMQTIVYRLICKLKRRNRLVLVFPRFLRYLGINGHCLVFSTLQSKPVKAAYVRTLLPRLVRKAGVQKRVHPHGLCHSFAYELAGE